MGRTTADVVEEEDEEEEEEGGGKDLVTTASWPVDCLAFRSSCSARLGVLIYHTGTENIG